jgi:hypothetical protein
MGSAAGLGFRREIFALPRFWAGVMAAIPLPSLRSTEPSAIPGRGRAAPPEAGRTFGGRPAVPPASRGPRGPERTRVPTIQSSA